MDAAQALVEAAQLAQDAPGLAAVVNEAATHVLNTMLETFNLKLRDGKDGERTRKMVAALIAMYVAALVPKNESEVMAALRESVNLQAHYAKLLNMHDGGERVAFASAEDWMQRLREVGDLQPDVAERDKRVYIGVDTCGCVMGICRDTQDEATAEAVAQFIREGMAVEHVSARLGLRLYKHECPHRPKAPDAAQS